MKRIIIIGNSSSGKSTLALNLKSKYGLSHLDLDTLAWMDTKPVKRAPLLESKIKLENFIAGKPDWVIESCYADLIELVIPESNELIFMNLSVEECIRNARSRPWEPHKYRSKKEQDAHLDFLIRWIGDYENREDEFSKAAHLKLFNSYDRSKRMIRSNQDAL